MSQLEAKRVVTNDLLADVVLDQTSRTMHTPGKYKWEDFVHAITVCWQGGDFHNSTAQTY